MATHQNKSRYPEKVLLRMPTEMRAKVSEKAATRGQSNSEFIRQAIRSSLASN